MKQEVIESYREMFDLLKEQHIEIENQLIVDSSNQISKLVEKNKFNEAQAAIDYLKTLIEEIKFDVNFDKIETQITQYNNKMNALMNIQLVETSSSNQNDVPIEKFQKKEIIQMSKNESQVSQILQEENKLDFFKTNFSKHGFKFINSENEIHFELKKERRHFYFTIIESELTKEDYFELLERQSEKKNIGFIFENESELVKAKELSKEWIEISPEHKKRFLTINFTTKVRLEEKETDIFDIASYEKTN